MLLQDDCEQVTLILAEGPRTMDELAQRLGWGHHEVNVALCGLLLANRVSAEKVRGPGGKRVTAYTLKETSA